MNRNLESLLRWSVENSQQSGQSGSTAVAPVESDGSAEVVNTADSAAPATASSSKNKLDPGIIDAILGKSDAQRMKECVQDLQSESMALDDKLVRWDELELLVESLDNANDLENMKLWQPIFSFLSDPNEQMRLQAAWVLGTAIQNNPRSQSAFFALDPLPTLLDALRNEQSSEVRSKLMYTLSGVLRHNSPAVTNFSGLGGWGVLRSCLSEDPSLTIRRKTAFLLNSLFVHSTTLEESQSSIDHAQKDGVVDALIDGLDRDTATPAGLDGEVEDIDQDLAEKALQALVSISQLSVRNPVFTDSQREKLRKVTAGLDKDKGRPGDIAQSEWTAFVSSL